MRSSVLAQSGYGKGVLVSEAANEGNGAFFAGQHNKPGYRCMYGRTHSWIPGRGPEGHTHGYRFMYGRTHSWIPDQVRKDEFLDAGSEPGRTQDSPPILLVLKEAEDAEFGAEALVVVELGVGLAFFVDEGPVGG